ncbi:uncharacterized protein LOC106365824 [Brassica napus]|uniref:uncharacterized protein LOC106365824 n=1 Tax=Brassica napus TaxID=3708 RepID=UPI0006AB6BB3|nr:uncharacterized protein LOC106365824 [Brassica napus]
MAIFSIKAESAPGPDGMTGLFFQKFWDVIGDQVTKEIHEVFISGVLPSDWNFTHICLLPKVQNPENMTDLRPISLCSVLYKAVAKILVTRMQPLLGLVVSINQSAFVSERLISDNIIIAHEAVHALKVQPVVANEFMAVKTNMSKAYDRVEWSYIRSLLLALGFCDKWVEWIMMCVTSVTFSVLINDQPFGLITPQRGIRQGDLLSPFLFVLCTEGVMDEERLKIQQILGIWNEGGASKYLGLPECFSGSKVELFSSLKECTQGRVEGWSMRKLSQSGKEVLLKSVITFLPSSDVHIRKIHWVAWDKLCLPKYLGGIGFTDLECFNQALLPKQAWKLLTSPLSLLSLFLKSRYFPLVDFFSASLGERPSYVWKSLLFGRELLLKGLMYRVGIGRKTRVWANRWLDDPVEGLRAPWVKNITFDVNLMVSDLIDSSSRNWNLAVLNDLFVPGDVSIITAKLPAVDREDFWVWRFNHSGNFTVKSAYWLATSTKVSVGRREAESLPFLCPLKEQVWKVITAPKIRVFLWKCLSNALPVAELISERGMKVNMRCQLCGLEGESINHTLFECCVARQVWALSGMPHPRNGFCDSSIFANVNYLLKMSKNLGIQERARRSWPWLLWNLWKNRNHLIFEGTSFSCTEIARKAAADADEWFMAHRIEEEWLRLEETPAVVAVEKWRPHRQNWFMCNIAVDWAKYSLLTGGAWVLRDEKGVVLCHSRRTFGQFPSKEQAKETIVLWAVESMRSQKVSRVIFTGEFKEIFGAVNMPSAWPSFCQQGDNVRRAVVGIAEWEALVIDKNFNRGASFIAQSVKNCGFTQSYVSSGHPRWLHDLFVDERSAL